MNGLFVVEGIHDSEVNNAAQINEIGLGTILNALLRFDDYLHGQFV